jgi:hypothetical protein
MRGARPANDARAAARFRSHDPRWVKHKGKRAVHGFEAHVGADADTALVEELSVTSGNINDGKAGPEALPDNPGEGFAGSGYRGNHCRDAIVSEKWKRQHVQRSTPTRAQVSYSIVRNI